MMIRGFRVSPLALIFAEIFFLGIVGGAVVFFFDTRYFLRFFDEEAHVVIPYLSVVYAFAVMIMISYILGLERKLVNYAQRKCIYPEGASVWVFWWLTFFATLFCFLYVFVQVGMTHPILSAIRAEDYFQVSVIRHYVSKRVDMRIYNLGLTFFLPLNIVISFFIVRKFLSCLLSGLLLCIVGTFMLSKVAIVYIIIFLAIFRMLSSPLNVMKASKYLVVILCCIVLLFLGMRYARVSLRSVQKKVVRRIFYGQIIDLPYYFEVFSDRKVSLKSLLPPYIGEGGEPAARTVALYGIEKRFSNDEKKDAFLSVAGHANTFLTGEAFAWAGYFGVIISPLLVMANLAGFIYLFTRIRKTWISVYVFSFLLYKVFVGVFGGISFFIFSSMHIMVIAVLIFVTISYYVRKRKILIFDNCAKKLGIR